MRAALSIIMCGGLLLLSIYCRAWSEAGHIVIADLAYDKLPIQARRQLDQYAGILLDGAPESAASWRRRYPAFSPLSYIAAWPDTIRELTVADIFARYHVDVPSPLAKYQARTTGNWHYTNRWYYNDAGKVGPAQCERLTNHGRLLPVVELLYRSFEQSRSPEQRAVILAFLIHLVSDLHQPLHNFSRVGEDCRHDGGGGGFCVAKPSKGRCERNLHQWWDSGGGLFSRPLEMNKVDKIAAGVDTGQTVESITRDSIGRLARAWSDESRAFTASIYALDEGVEPGESYTVNARRIIEKQAALAGKRLQTIYYCPF